MLVGYSSVGPLWFLQRYFLTLCVDTAAPSLTNLVRILIFLDALYDVACYLRQHDAPLVWRERDGRPSCGHSVGLIVQLAPRVRAKWCASTADAPNFEAARAAIGASSGDYAMQIANGQLQVRSQWWRSTCEIEFAANDGVMYAAEVPTGAARGIFATCARLLQG